MKMTKINLLASLVLVGVALPFPAGATVLSINNAAIQQVMSDSPDIAYGGCLAVLDKPIGTGCTGNTVSFDCAGKYNTIGGGNRLYSTALLAFSLNKPVNLVVDNLKKYVVGVKTYCVATRITVLK